MFAKSLLAAAAIAASTVALAPVEANAKTHVDVFLGVGGFAPRYDGYYAREYEVVRPRYRSYRHAEPIYRDTYYSREGLSCGRAARTVRSAGFHEINAYDCSAPTYGYTAWRHGEKFRFVSALRVTSSPCGKLTKFAGVERLLRQSIRLGKFNPKWQ